MNSENKEQKAPKTINEKELEILEFWNENKIFEKSLQENKGREAYTFYDGPPFATGMPHNGHLMQSYLKDSIPRYQTMKGKFVRRVWGWDTHGLPIENLIEKEMGFKSKADIETFGVGNFTKAATDSVMRFESEWKKIIPRIGRFVDMENRYITLNNTYTESCWWAFSELYKKGLAYEGYKVMHICPRCETPLAASEVAQGYADVKDISVYVKFKLFNDDISEGEVNNAPETDDESKGDETASLLAWTTTPWTLPGNTAIVVNKNLTYQKVEFIDANGVKQKLILAKDLAPKVLAGLDYEVDKEFSGEKLVGKSYRPVFDYYNNQEFISKLENHYGEKNGQNIYKVWHADFVTADAGTGIAHEAPAFGEDDYNLAIQNNIPLILHIGMDGRFNPEVTDFAGERVKWKGETQATDKKICEFLKEKNQILKTEIITHSYPLCWRCDTPLLNYATNSWFVAVTKMREKLVDENKKVYWVPENVRDGRMGQWLEGARDWALSRNRYWGAPIPVWKSKDGKEVFVPGSLKDLQSKTKAKNNYLFIRHGETDSNKKNLAATENAIASGTIDVVLGSDSSLNAQGKTQAENVGIALKNRNINLDDVVIVTSPYKRTFETAKIIGSILGIGEDKIIQEEKIQEWQVGEANNGKSWTQFYQENAGVNYLHKLMTGSKETKLDVQNRMSLFVTEMEEKYVGKTILVVTHKSPIACIISRNNGELFEFGTGNLPVWHNAKNCEIIDLVWKPLPTDEVGAVNFHLPHIDNLKVYANDGTEMKREGGVFDCWFESGSMPYAQFHYPFENKELFKENFPAEFIAEAQDQTRGWFYTMLVLGVGLFDKSPFKSVITSGLIMAGDGKKMSKRDKNYTDPMEIVEKYGSDAMRYYILSSPVVKGESIRFTDLGVAQVYSKNITRLLNVLSFYKMYAKENVLAESTSEHVLDKFIVSRLKQVKHEVTKGFEELFVDMAFRPVEKFVDDLSVWFLRRSRDRFKSDDEAEVKKVLQTTKYILQEFAKVLAPIMPFTAEMIWLEIRDNTEPISVHLTNWGESDSLDEGDVENIEKMELVREIVSTILDERVKAGIKVRQPLASTTFNSSKFSSILNDEDYLKEIKDETNIREVKIHPDFVSTSFDKESTSATKLCVLDIVITEELRIEGAYRELVRMIQDKRKLEGLLVSDKVSIVLDEKMSDLEKSVVEKMKVGLMKETGLSNISFGTEFKIVK